MKREEVKVEDTVVPLLDNQIRWINFWDAKAPPLVVDNNIQINMGAKYGVAHNVYWEHGEMYEEICGYFFI